MIQCTASVAMSVSVYGLGAAHASLILVHKLKNTVLQNALLILSIVNKFKNTVLQNVRGSVDAAAESTGTNHGEVPPQ